MSSEAEQSIPSRGSVDGLENRLKKHAENAPYWLLHECQNEWTESSVALMDEAAQEINRLASLASALKVCEAWLQKQVAERDAELAEIRKTAAALMEIATSDADVASRKRILDAMEMESFAENG